MRGQSIVCKLMTIMFIICIIVAPVFDSKPLDRHSAIAFLCCILPWVIASIIADAKDSAKFEDKIKSLEDRIEELEDKNK